MTKKGTPPEELSNLPTARANFGYVAIPGIALSSMSTDGKIHTLGDGSGQPPNVDTADRLLIFGGQDSSFNPAGGIGYLADAYKFNPTYGPELFDVMSSTNTGQLVQWLGNYQSQIIENGNPASLFSINYPTPNPSGSTLPSSSFGATALHNTNAPYAGYVLAVGGFDSTLYAATTGT